MSDSDTLSFLTTAEDELQTGLSFFQLGSQHRVLDRLTEERLLAALDKLYEAMRSLERG